MNDPFEKFDKAALDAFEEFRNRPIPKKISENFAGDVEKRILQRKQQRFFMGISLASACVAVLAGFLIWKMTLVPQAKQIQKQVAPLTAVSPAPIAASPAVSTTAEPPLADENSSNIITDIEALKRLGVWTDEDDHSIGISEENSFNEMDLLVEDTGSQNAARLQNIL